MKVFRIALAGFFLSSALGSATAEHRRQVESVVNACAASQAVEPQSCAPFYPYSGHKLDSDVVDALPAGQWSKALQTLFQQARTSAKVPIRFTRLTAGAFGFVERVVEGYVIGIRPDLDQEEQESDMPPKFTPLMALRPTFRKSVIR